MNISSILDYLSKESIPNDNNTGFMSRSIEIKPMQNNEVQMVIVDTKKKDCKLKLSKFYIKKEERLVKNDEKTFYFASLDKRFIPNDMTKLAFNYKSQIGFTRCSKGYIEFTLVNGPKYNIDARGCGIGTIFASLCMTDSDVNMLPGDKIMEEFSSDLKTAKTIKTGCSKFLGLLMISTDISGPYKNFNAALKNGYNKFLIRNKKEKYIWMDTEKAKECFNDETGDFGDGITGLGNYWWFCEAVPGKFPNFPSLNVCSDKPKF